MSDDLVKRLNSFNTMTHDAWGILIEAADRIEKLEADLETATMKRLLDSNRIEKLEDALHTIYKCCDEAGNCSIVRRIVRKALEGER